MKVTFNAPTVGAEAKVGADVPCAVFSAYAALDEANILQGHVQQTKSTLESGFQKWMREAQCR